MEYWQNPSLLLKEMARVENDTLFIIEHYNRLSEIVEACTAPFRQTLELIRAVWTELMSVRAQYGGIVGRSEGRMRSLLAEKPTLHF
jgi:hypothetical protein